MKLKKVWDLLDGKKRYIGLFIMFIGGGLKAVNFIDLELSETIIAFGAAVASFGFGAFAEKKIK